MTTLAQTHGLTELQTDILSTVRTFVDKEIIPHAQESTPSTEPVQSAWRYQ